MALPITLSGIQFVQPCGGPHKASSAFYAVGRDSTNTDDLHIQKATSPDTSWSEQDTANVPSPGTVAIDSIHSVVDGTTIHVAFQDQNKDVYYSTYNTSTDAWGSTTDTVDANPDGNTEFCSIGVRSDGDVLIAYQGTQEASMGSNYERVDLATDTGTGWTAGTAIGLTDKTQVNETYPWMGITDNDRAHIFFHDATNFNVHYSTRLSGDTWGHQNSNTNQEILTLPDLAVISYNNGTTTKVRHFSRPTGSEIDVLGFDDADSPGTSIKLVDDLSGTETADGQNSGSAAELNDVQYFVVTDSIGSGGNVDIYNTGTDNNTWSTLELDHVTSLGSSNKVHSANAYDNGGDVFAYLYYDGSNYRYNERALSSDTNISANLESLTLTEQQSSVALDVGVAAAVKTLALTEQQATIEFGANVLANTAALTLAEQAASVADDVNVGAAVASLALTEQPAGVALDIDIAANTAALALTTLQATKTLDVNVGAAVASLALTEQPASIVYDVDVLAAVESLVLTEQQATIEFGANVQANTAVLTLTEQAASITHDVDVQAAVNALALTEQAASITYDVDVQAAVNALALTTFPASLSDDVNVAAATEALTLTGQAASITYDVDVRAAAVTLALTEQAASVVYEGVVPAARANRSRPFRHRSRMI